MNEFTFDSLCPADGERLSDVQMAFALTSFPEAITSFLRECKEVRGLVEALESNVVTDEHLNTAVGRWTKAFQKGRRFAHERELAALAVAVEGRYTPFAERFLAELAGARRPEIPLAWRIAREILRERETRRDAASIQSTDPYRTREEKIEEPPAVTFGPDEYPTLSQFSLPLMSIGLQDERVAA